MISRKSPGTAVPARLANLEVQIAAAISIVGTLALKQVPFSFATATPLVLQSLAAGALVFTGAVLVTSPFDAGATLSFGTSADPSAVLGPSDSDLTRVEQYESDLMVPIGLADVLLLTLSPGLTQGEGILFYRLIN
jgi:hypothetical protein